MVFDGSCYCTLIALLKEIIDALIKRVVIFHHVDVDLHARQKYIRQNRFTNYNLRNHFDRLNVISYRSELDHLYTQFLDRSLNYLNVDFEKEGTTLHRFMNCCPAFLPYRCSLSNLL